ncbi:MAG: hypothetical protein IPK13_05985 [Deltaproteobacteria bacterium]|nr:hypothetical protein [Deltaproteobacteria bacterium]
MTARVLAICVVVFGVGCGSVRDGDLGVGDDFDQDAASSADAVPAAGEDGARGPDGSTAGASDGSVTGASDGSVTGASDGSVTGASDGSTTGASDGSTTGASDGSTTGASDGSTTGVSDGSTTGVSDGSTSADGGGDASLCSSTMCDVSRFSGTDDERIQRAIAAALVTQHRTVFFPNGRYELHRSILIDAADARLILRGASRANVVLVSAPITLDTIVSGVPTVCLGPMFQIDRGGGFTRMDLLIENFTIDFGRNMTDPIYLNAGCSGSAHGVRVGNGWQTGQLRLNNLTILNPTGYGIGIQNAGAGDISANNVEITNVYVKNAGMDGFDAKTPAAGNENLLIDNMMVDQIGFNDEGSAAGIDIRYNDFTVRNVSVITEAERQNPRGRASNTGIRIRDGGVHHGTIRNVYVRGTGHALFFEGKAPTLNTDVTIEDFIVKQFEGTGVYVRGTHLVIQRGCSFSGAPSSRYLYVDPVNSDPATNVVSVHNGYDATLCPAYEAVGYHP